MTVSLPNTTGLSENELRGFDFFDDPFNVSRQKSCLNRRLRVLQVPPGKTCLRLPAGRREGYVLQRRGWLDLDRPRHFLRGNQALGLDLELSGPPKSAVCVRDVAGLMRRVRGCR